MGLKNPGISGKSQKNPRDEKMSKNEKKNKKSEKNLKIKNQRKITTVDIPLCCFFRRLFRDLKFLRNFHKTYR